MTAMRNLLVALVAMSLLAGSARAELLVNGDFSAGLTGWTIWTQRNDGGNFTVTVDGGLLQQRGDSYNGGVYQVVAVPPNLPLVLNGGWQSNPTVASEQWAEVIVIEGNSPPIDGVDVLGPLIFKNDTFGGDVGGWSGEFVDTSPVAYDPFGGPMGSGSPSGFVTVILKSGSINPGTLNGVDFGNLSLTAVIPEPSSLALVVAAVAFAVLPAARRWRNRRHGKVGRT